MVTTIQLDEKIKSNLDKLKIHHRETYNELIARLIIVFSQKSQLQENIIETMEVLSSPETMRNIAQGLEDYKKGNYVTLDSLKKKYQIE